MEWVAESRTVVAPARFVEGWLGGWALALSTSPRLESAAQALQDGLTRAGVDAGWFLALIARVDRFTVEYTGLSHSFPDPLLMLDDVGVTYESAAPASEGRSIRHLLRPPWKLVIASDGLLERLGGGSESRGRASLLRWHSGTTRDEPLDARLDVDTNQVDDETIMVVEWDDWDLELAFNPSAKGERARVDAQVRRWLDVRLEARAADTYDNAIVEALDNSETHGYASGPGRLVLRLRDEGGRIRAQVRDAGTWTGARIIEGHGFRAMRAVCTHVDLCRVYPHGMCVSLVFETPNSEIQT